MIVVITGIGHNLTSLRFALERLGVKAIFTDDKEVIVKATRVILPGVGSANQAMKNLREKNLVNTIKQLTVPVLGICLGMQILMSFSEEANTDTLNIISGNVRRIQPNSNLIVPHMGWNRIISVDEEEPLLANVPEESYLYFVHSFAVAQTPYTRAISQHGVYFSSVIRKDNFCGVQFHPERSGSIGQLILKNFLN